MNANPWMSILGLANRAQKITSGEELTVKAIQSGKAKLVLLTRDASLNTTKKITDKCKTYSIPYKLVENRYLLGQAIGKEARVVVTVMDDGFAKKLVTLLD